MTSKVSIIIPFYNSEKHIKDAIESCINQTYKNIEIIVIDDGSTDNSKNIIMEYIKRAEIKYFYQNNKERSAARNLGLDVATGEYINFLDSDDLLHSTKIEKQVSFLEKNKDYFATYSAVEYFKDKPGESISTLAKDCNTPQIMDDLLLGNFIPIQSIMIRENSIRFDESLSALEDWYYFLSVLVNQRVYFSHEILSSVRIDRHLSSNYKLKMMHSEIQVFIKIIHDKRFEYRKMRMVIVLVRRLIIYACLKVIEKIKVWSM